MLRWIVRQPLAILGAVGLISSLKSLITLHEDILFLVRAYQSVTQPVWEFLLGWCFRWLQLPFPWWAKDYLTIGLITFAALARARRRELPDANRFARAIWIISNVLAWPLNIIYDCVRATSARSKVLEKTKRIDEYHQLRNSNPKAYEALKDKQLGDPIYWAEHDRRQFQAEYDAIMIVFEFVAWAAIILGASYALFICAPPR